MPHVGGPPPEQQSTALFGGGFSEDDVKLALVDFARSIRKRKWAILGFALAVMAVTAAVVFSLTPIYRATTTILIEAGKAKVVSIEDVYSGISQNREYFQTQVEILKSREVAIRAIKALQLWNEPSLDPRKRDTGRWQRTKEALGLGDPPPEGDWTEEALAMGVYGKFKDALSVDAIRQSQLAKISYDSPNRQLAAQVTDMVAKVYVQNDIDAKIAMTQQANEWLNSRVGELKRNVNDAERKLQNYRESSGLVDAKGVAQSGAARQIDELSQRLVGVRLRSSELESAYRQIKNLPRGTDYAGVPTVVRSANVLEAKRALGEAERKLSEVSQRYGSEHPRFIAARAEVDAAADNVRRQMDSVVEAIQREYEQAVTTEQSIEASLNKARGKVQAINRKEYELQQLEREAQSNRELFDLFVKRSKETSSTVDSQSAIARVVDAAVIPGAPVKPQKAQILLISFILALLVGAAAALFIDQLDNTIKVSSDVDVKLKSPLLTSLPMLTPDESRRQNSVRLYIDQPNSNYAEAVRSARTGVLLSNIDTSQRTLLVTSALPSEGKTTIAANLALALAQTQRTLLIDADMRRPGVTKGLNLPPSTSGLSQLVAGTKAMDECIFPVDGSSLQVIPAGVLPPNPLELLLSKRFRDTLLELGKRYETIVIDSPPIELVSDAQVIAPYVTGVVFVTAAMQTPIPIVRKGLEKVRRAGGLLIGVALNKFDFSKAESYYGEYSGYGKYGGKYGYKDGQGYGGTAYGADEHTKPARRNWLKLRKDAELSGSAPTSTAAR